MGGNAAGIFTELAILYVKYNESKLMDHLRQFFSRVRSSVNSVWKESGYQLSLSTTLNSTRLAF